MQLVSVDVSELAPPEPMTVILTALASLELDHCLLVTHRRQPFPLYEKLIQAGFTVELKGEKLNRWLKNNNYPKGFQILCWNCNFAKGVLGQCPHQD